MAWRGAVTLQSCRRLARPAPRLFSTDGWSDGASLRHDPTEFVTAPGVGPALIVSTRPLVLALFRRAWRTAGHFKDASAREYYRMNAYEQIYQVSRSDLPCHLTHSIRKKAPSSHLGAPLLFMLSRRSHRDSPTRRGRVLFWLLRLRVTPVHVSAALG